MKKRKQKQESQPKDSVPIQPYQPPKLQNILKDQHGLVEYQRPAHKASKARIHRIIEANKRKLAFRDIYGEVYFIIQKYKDKETGEVADECREEIIKHILDIDEIRNDVEFARLVFRRVAGTALMNGDIITANIAGGQLFEEILWGLERARELNHLQDHRNYVIELKSILPQFNPHNKHRSAFIGAQVNPDGTKKMEVAFTGTPEEVMEIVEKTTNKYKDQTVVPLPKVRAAIEEDKPDFQKSLKVHNTYEMENNG